MNRIQKKSFWALMVTQFFGAFNDNVLKVLVTLLIVQWVADVGWREQLVDLSGAVFVLPFLLFSMIAGRIADRVGKPRVIIATKFWELLVVAAAALSLWAKSIPSMMGALFMLSMQATFFSPAKYGVMPELMGEDEISKGNGWLNMGTFLAILLGTVTGSFLSASLITASAVMLVASVAGLFASYFMEPLPAAKPEEALALDPLQDLVANWKLIYPNRGLRLGSVAVNYFWFMGAVLQLNIFLYASQMMNASPKISGLLIVAVAIGIGLGSFLAGELSGGRVELGMVPLGALGMSLFAIDLLWAYHSMLRLYFDLFMLGMSAGFYDIPLSAFVQWRSPKGERGRVMATINFFSFVAILGASGMLWVLNTALHLNPAQVFFTMGLFSLVVTGVLCTAFPDVRQRFMMLVLRHNTHS
jgi:acyl-[acyl-carrier-protein]-phospholipid O-acyltransferase/long-chain-fatty-acid--[acyl-carrier-protein] ligase